VLLLTNKTTPKLLQMSLHNRITQPTYIFPLTFSTNNIMKHVFFMLAFLLTTLVSNAQVNKPSAKSQINALCFERIIDISCNTLGVVVKRADGSIYESHLHKVPYAKPTARVKRIVRKNNRYWNKIVNRYHYQ